MDFKYGDILVFATPYHGNAVMMVINPPVVCQHCGKVITGWDYDEEGKIRCPYCELNNVNPPIAIDRFGNELMSLAVASNDDQGIDSPHEVPQYNYLVNHIYTFSKKSIESDIQSGEVRLCDDEEAFNRKCMVVWVNTPGYYAGAPVPEWIKEMIRGENSSTEG